MAMNSFDGQDADRNIFRKVFSNILPFPQHPGQIVLDGGFAVSIATLHSFPSLNPEDRCNHAVLYPLLSLPAAVWVIPLLAGVCLVQPSASLNSVVCYEKRRRALAQPGRPIVTAWPDRFHVKHSGNAGRRTLAPCRCWMPPKSILTAHRWLTQWSLTKCSSRRLLRSGLVFGFTCCTQLSPPHVTVHLSNMQP